MKLENVTAEIRPRGKWESVDLGVALVQKNYKDLMFAWLMTVVPLLALILGGSYFWYKNEDLWYQANDSGLYALFYATAPFLLVWWLKPIYERIPLYILSRSLFGEKLDIGQLVRRWPSMIFKGVFRLLITRRVSMSRSFAMPVHELEGLKGSQYAQRVNLLSRNGGDGASGLTFSCAFVSHICLLAFYISFRWLTMYGFDTDDLNDKVAIFTEAFVGYRMQEAAILPLLFFLVNYMVVVSFITPFYVGAGFAIYINSRTVSEGWDIELAFKRMSERLQTASKGISHSLMLVPFVVLCLFSFASSSGFAAQENEDNKLAESILEGDAFDVEIQEIEQPVYNSDINNSDSSSGDVSGLAGLFQVLMWLVVVGVVVALVVLLVQNSHIFRAGRPDVLAKADHTPRARTVLGMDISKESLPADIVSAARKAWLFGEKKQALSLFYRGSLEWMVNSARLPILESDTEHDCVEHCKAIGNESVNGYFKRLTEVWVALAYGKVDPQDDSIDWLCNDWPFQQTVTNTGGAS